MKVVALLLSVASVVCADEVPVDEAGMSLLQHNVRTIRKGKVEGEVEAPPGAPPPGVAERIAARRERKRNERAAGRNPETDLPADVMQRRRDRRRAKRQAAKAARAAGQSHFGDGGQCDTCAAQCTGAYNDEFRDCMERENCRPWQKEDGAASFKCNRRCDRAGNWKREPCIRECQCDVDLVGVSSTMTEDFDWADGHHRCKDFEIGSQSNCPSLSEETDSSAYDSIKKCAAAAVRAGADTFNFYRTSKEYGKCSLRNCGSGDLQISRAPPAAESPAGRGGWKVFSTFCAAPPDDQQSDTGADGSSR